jgi:hypothetical protein
MSHTGNIARGGIQGDTTSKPPPNNGSSPQCSAKIDEHTPPKNQDAYDKSQKQTRQTDPSKQHKVIG